MNIAIILAGGKGTRMGNNVPKQFIEVNSKPIIMYTLDVFENNPLVDAIIIVCKETWMERVKTMIKRYDINKVVKIVKGGKKIQESIYHGLLAANEWVRASSDDVPEDCVVLIHDAVRPMIKENTITTNIENARKYGNSITVAPPSETFILEENGKPRLFRRENVHIVRAPQCFYLKDILNLHKRAIDDGNTEYNDCSSLLCEYDIPFHETMGDSTNIKITYPTDIFTFRALIHYLEVQKIIGIE